MNVRIIQIGGCGLKKTPSRNSCRKNKRLCLQWRKSGISCWLLV